MGGTAGRAGSVGWGRAVVLGLIRWVAQHHRQVHPSRVGLMQQLAGDTAAVFVRCH